MSHPRARISRLRRVFVGCEGESERSYVAWLQTVLDELRFVPGSLGRGVALHAVLLKPGAGDPAALIELALKKIAEYEGRNGPYATRAVLLDGDRRAESPDRLVAAVRGAVRKGLRLIWQDPRHEGLILRHLPNCEYRRPSVATVDADLRREWPGYVKRMEAAALARRLGLADLRRVLRVEPDLAAFLAELGFRP